MWLWGALSGQGKRGGALHGVGGELALADLAGASCLGTRLEELRGRSVLLAVRDQFCASLALIELDGVARKLVLCPPDLSPAHLPFVVATAGADACVRDGSGPATDALGLAACVECSPALQPQPLARRATHETDWILLTSGTTGAPKLVRHTLATLTHAIRAEPAAESGVVWSTFYDIRRYGGLQIFLRAVHTGSLVLSSPAESVIDHLSRAAAAGVTHISGTPSHWRRALMSGAAAQIAPHYVRLSGEIADQAILDALRAAYPRARIAHAFASTEAGVAFEVGDGLAGFPADLVGAAGAVTELGVENGTLRIRSGGNALGYLGEDAPVLKDGAGWVDTGDRVELREGRYYFVGRSGGVINVGGLKVHPEEVEAVINAYPGVRMSLVRARRSPIMGAVVAADVVLEGADAPAAGEALTRDIIEACRRVLAPHKVPALIRVVPALEVSPSGKLVRPNA